MVSIAADRDMVTTAEGVETEEQRATVQALGCTQMQGYLFSPPRRAQEVRGLLGPRAGRKRGVSWMRTVPRIERGALRLKTLYFALPPQL